MVRPSLKIIALAVVLSLHSKVLPLDVPPLKSRVMDLAGLLTPSQIYKLEEKLYSFEKQTSNQIAVLIIPSLEGENIEEYSIRVVEKWKLGAKGKDNGVLLLIALKERKIRIEVGYGLEGALPDIIAFNIIRTQITPHFKRGKYYTGILSGIEAIMDATRGEYTAETPTKKEKNTRSTGSLLIFIILMLLFLIPGRGRMGWFWAGVGMGSFFRGSGGGFGGFGGGGGGFGGGGASGSW